MDKEIKMIENLVTHCLKKSLGENIFKRLYRYSSFKASATLEISAFVASEPSSNFVQYRTLCVCHCRYLGTIFLKSSCYNHTQKRVHFLNTVYIGTVTTVYTVHGFLFCYILP